ncbi:MAG: hypothetical protein HY658_07365 [Actinobacteria bacterium]|nr:hypothetical protein [Actinomycetota bacterium]
MDVEAVQASAGRTPYERVLAALVGAAALMAALLATLEMHAGKREERALVMASRLSTAIFEGTAASGVASTFQLSVLKQSIEPGLAGAARLEASLDDPELIDVEFAIAMAQAAAQERIFAVAQAMGAPPGSDSGLDAHTVEVLNRPLETLSEVSEEQNRQVDLAERFGERSNRAVFALSLVAIAAVLLGVAGVIGRSPAGRVALVSAGAVLVLSAGWGASALAV